MTLKTFDKLIELSDLPARQIREFAKFSGATLSEVKWSDYKKVRLKREP